ncbi:MAG: circularly permuted type 2 ATP-grasp protein [Desulfuromonadaceae bacterium]|nr:circularly permuted type 2 ATP-grasp protein [Desulfuromonadaceae bacterium]
MKQASLPLNVQYEAWTAGQFTGLTDRESVVPQHWQQLLEFLVRFGENRLARRCRDAERLLKENGAIHNIFNSPESPRSWQFDPIPVIFGSTEWSQLERGLLQRAELLNAVLRDLYGPRTLIRDGLLPADLVFAHRHFLPACDGQMQQDFPLSFYTPNLAKGGDGQYWVLADATLPSLGAGYALESRLIMSRSFPQLFEPFQVHRLAMYFLALRTHLSRLSPQQEREPSIVLLTPGPDHPSFFEHAYLASYLGFPLVQGGDLVVRDDRVWLKSVDGLRQVDVILRRVVDELCDPLELRGDSWCGIPGLLEAVRCGQVAVANPIGCQVLENPALMAFLPGICQHLRDEELLLPSVATWWCGQPYECNYVLDHLDELIIRPIYPLPGLPPSKPGQLSAAQRQQWRQIILDKPQLFVGQQLVELATFPTYEKDAIVARPGITTFYLSAQDSQYVMMPGGLTRVHEDDSSLLANNNGGLIKDTWVLTQERDKQVNLWLQARPNQLLKPVFMPLPSRCAENLFWAGRYAERTEQTARLVRSILTKLYEVNEFRDPDDRQSLDHLLRALTEVTLTTPGFIGEGADKLLADPRGELHSLVCEDQRIGSLRASLVSLGQAAYAVRDLLPEDGWRIVDQLRQNWRPRVTKAQIGSGKMVSNVNQLIVQLAALSGLTNENMSRETAWMMLYIGRRLERALTLIALLQATLVPCQRDSSEAQIREAVLSTCNSLMVFRRRYRSFMQLSLILELLIFDEYYPRSLAYQLRQLRKHIARLPHKKLGPHARSDQQLIDEALDELRHTTHKKLAVRTEGEDEYPLLRSFLASQQQRLDLLSHTLMQLYFSPSVPLQQLRQVPQEERS